MYRHIIQKELQGFGLETIIYHMSLKILREISEELFTTTIKILESKTSGGLDKELGKPLRLADMGQQ